MTFPRRLSLFAFFSAVALMLSACGAASTDATIATSVALTVQAQNTLSAQSTPTVPAPSDTPTLFTTLTPLATKAPPTAPIAGTSQLCTASASFISETIPDGTITSPGSVFKKIWRIQNTGTCSWNSNWKFVYVSGDLLGGATVYNFPQPAAPGDTVDVPIIFTAPQEGGSYRGYWKIQSPWGLAFGDSGSGNPFWVDIVVGSSTPSNSKTQTIYDVTSVVYHVTRRCTAANTFWHLTADISSNGPVTVTFNWLQSDGNGNRNKKVIFDSASTITVDDGEWSQRTITSSPNARWIQIITTSPTYREWPHSEAFYLCGY